MSDWSDEKPEQYSRLVKDHTDPMKHGKLLPPTTKLTITPLPKVNTKMIVTVLLTQITHPTFNGTN